MHRETLNVLTLSLYKAGEFRRALAHAEHLASLYGDDQGWQQVVDVIRQAAARTP